MTGLGMSVLLLEAENELYLERNAAFKCSSQSVTFEARNWKHNLFHLKVLFGILGRSCKVSCFTVVVSFESYHSKELLCAVVGAGKVKRACSITF